LSVSVSLSVSVYMCMYLRLCPFLPRDLLRAMFLVSSFIRVLARGLHSCIPVCEIEWRRVVADGLGAAAVLACCRECVVTPSCQLHVTIICACFYLSGEMRWTVCHDGVRCFPGSLWLHHSSLPRGARGIRRAHPRDVSGGSGSRGRRAPSGRHRGVAV
jgi:hypothetical protein